MNHCCQLDQGIVQADTDTGAKRVGDEHSAALGHFHICDADGQFSLHC